METIGDLQEASDIAQRAILWYEANQEPVGEEFIERTIDLLKKKFKIMETIKAEQYTQSG